MHSLLGRRATTTLGEIRKVMLLIDKRAQQKGLRVRHMMTYLEVNSLFAHGEDAITELVPATTNTGRVRNVSGLRVKTVVTYITKQKKEG